MLKKRKIFHGLRQLIIDFKWSLTLKTKYDLQERYTNYRCPILL